MASVKENYGKDGKIISYRFRACIGRDDLGKQKFVTRTVTAPNGMTPGKAMKKMQLEADEWERGILAGIVPVKKQTFKYFVESVWFPTHVMSGEHSPSTIDFYKHMTVRLVERFGDIDLTAIKPLDIQRFLNDLRKTEQANGKPLSDTTIKHYQNVLRILFAFAEKHDLVERDPMRKVDAVKTDAHPVDFLAPDDAKRFLKCLEAAPLRWRCMMTLLVNCGLRRGEACGLQWSDIDFKASTISVNRSATYTKVAGVVVGKPKSANSVRTLPLTFPMLALLKEWQKVQAEESHAVLMPNAYIFSLETNVYEPMHPNTPTRWLKRFTKANKLPDVSPHDLRHTCGSLMLMSGASVKDTQDFLGHEDAKTTLHFYAGTTPESLRKAADGLAAVLQA